MAKSLAVAVRMVRDVNVETWMVRALVEEAWMISVLLALEVQMVRVLAVQVKVDGKNPCSRLPNGMRAFAVEFGWYEFLL